LVKAGRDEDDRDVGAGGRDGVGDGAEDRHLDCPPGKSTVVPALRGLTPPTTFVPEASIRVVCFMPSEPVMPWTMTLESRVEEDRHVECSLS
jgi:hypothetical protein